MENMVNQIHRGNCIDVMQKIPDESVDCVITSPPYWQLRHYEGIHDYIWGGDKECEHEFDMKSQKNPLDRGGKGQFEAGIAANMGKSASLPFNAGFCTKCGAWKGQLGLEPKFEMFLEHLYMIMDEVWRILKPTGTAWVNLGDTYSRTGGQSRAQPNALVGNQKKGVSKGLCHGVNGISDKCLLLIPHRFAIGCIDRGWVMRNDIIWAKPNGMPESASDRFTKKHEFIFFMTKNKRYYFNLDGIKDATRNWQADYRRVVADYTGGGKKHMQGGTSSFTSNNLEAVKERLQMGKNPGTVSDFWRITTKPSSSKHYATFNFKLIEKPIVAGCPEFVCKKCGKPRENIYGKQEQFDKQVTETVRVLVDDKGSTKEVIGKTSCGCNAGFEGGIVLDPFVGTGTTLVRALQLNRRVIGIDGSDDYAQIAERNIKKELDQFKLF